MFFATFSGQMLPLLLTVCFPLLFFLTGRALPQSSADGTKVDWPRLRVLEIPCVETQRVEIPYVETPYVDTADTRVGMPILSVVTEQGELPLPPAPVLLFSPFPVKGFPALPFLHHSGNKAPPSGC